MPAPVSKGRLHDGPRVSLRFLASYYYLAKLIVVYLCLWLMDFGLVGAVFVFAILVVLYGVIGGAMNTLRYEREPHEHLD